MYGMLPSNSQPPSVVPHTPVTRRPLIPSHRALFRLTLSPNRREGSTDRGARYLGFGGGLLVTGSPEGITGLCVSYGKWVENATNLELNTEALRGFFMSLGCFQYAKTLRHRDLARSQINTNQRKCSHSARLKRHTD